MKRCRLSHKNQLKAMLIIGIMLGVGGTVLAYNLPLPHHHGWSAARVAFSIEPTLLPLMKHFQQMPNATQVEMYEAGILAGYDPSVVLYAIQLKALTAASYSVEIRGTMTATDLSQEGSCSGPGFLRLCEHMWSTNFTNGTVTPLAELWVAKHPYVIWVASGDFADRFEVGGVDYFPSDSLQLHGQWFILRFYFSTPLFYLNLQPAVKEVA